MTTNPDRPRLGIDLGTTTTCVCVVDDSGEARVLANREGGTTTPSAVYFDSDGTAVVGGDALGQRGQEPGRVITEIKREIGGHYTVAVPGGHLRPEHVSALILQQVVEEALEALGVAEPADGPLASAVITVPAYFGTEERARTLEAGRMARLDVIDLINEPTAAALASGLRGTRSGRAVLVYDLGGGTFDVTIVRMFPQEVRVVATGGDARLGGADWDLALIDLVLDRMGDLPDQDDPRTSPRLMADLLGQVQGVKAALSTSTEQSVTARTARGRVHHVVISRNDYEKATSDLLDRTIDFTGDLIEQVRGLGVLSIDDVLLVGGMSRTPAVARRLAETFPRLPAPQLAADPELVVAKGAAQVAAGEARKIVDVTSKGYGVLITRDAGRPSSGSAVHWIIAPNTPLPTSGRHTLCIVRDGQTAMRIVVYESTTDVLSEDEADHIRLDEHTMEGLPRDSRRGDPVELDFSLGADGVLRIEAHAANGARLRIETQVRGGAADTVAPLPGLRR
ncbi:Hsp70 family protein [Actinokineospora sp. UTMC 2448]|uniref:Hsp70 family protein n=1 Tax=Actinokineospora sp. UTMC 2448 TaxID=2268449 RepID=UPI002164585A|nr:Hsp70 family protein [Actinokineospora sp. UTMC 2448]UVS80568.1 Heat shock protein 70 [Actinokineospora sp. UTMC 2448]